MTSHDIFLTLLLTAAIELVTVVLRLVWHLKSAQVQHKAHWPRTHHSYVGILVVALAMLGYLPSFIEFRTALIIGIALMASDVIHHAAMVPLLRRYGYDLRMVHHEVAHRYLVQWSGALAIAVGVFALLTPFTPGSWLIPMGFVSLVGKKRSRSLLQKTLGQTLYRRARLARFLGND
jgi:uncharacterized membrane protein HdeD (DUF308 family)